MLTIEIKNKIQALWDRLWAGGLSNPITAIEQISYLLFMKRLEVFKPDCPDLYKWSTYYNYDENLLVNHLKNKVFEYIKNDLSDHGEVFAKAMKDSIFLFDSSKASLLKDAIQYIDSIYNSIDEQIKNNNQYFHDIQGDIYEHLLKHTNEAGKNGQFRTPRHIIYMMAEIIDPDIDGKICDLACGTGGFLVGAYQYILTKYSEKIDSDEDGFMKGIDLLNLDEHKKNILKENTFYGFDIDKTMVTIGVMNLMMHGISKPNIVNCDTLSNNYEQVEFDRINSNVDIMKGQYKYILANPPFTGKINSDRISENIDRAYPPIYDKERKRKKQTVQSELLFLDRIVYMLEEGGKAAVIVPEGVLFNSGKPYKITRQILMTDCDLEGVISLPSGVFQPYTAVKTSILIFKKRKFKNGFDKIQNIDVWFYGIESDGYTLDSNRKKLKEKPLPEIIDRWKNRKSDLNKNRKLKHFSIPYKEIEKNGFELNFNLYKEFIYENQEFEPSNEILKKLMLLESEISSGLTELSKF